MIEIPVEHAYVMPLTVAEADIDAQDHVGNVRIVSWMNRAAIDHSAALGWDIEAYRRVGGMFVVRRHEITYHRQARLGDAVRCYTWPSDIGRATAARHHLIVRVPDATAADPPTDDATAGVTEVAGDLIAEGVNLWAFVDANTGRPRRIPAELRAAFDPANFT